MGIFTQQIFIPRALYVWMPLIYLLAGLLLFLVFAHALIKLAGLMLMAFAAYITIKRFSRPGNAGKTRARRRTAKYR